MPKNNFEQSINKMLDDGNLREQRLNAIWDKYEKSPMEKKKHFDMQIGKEYDPFDFEEEYASEHWQPQNKDYFMEYANHYGMLDENDEDYNKETFERWLSYLD